MVDATYSTKERSTAIMKDGRIASWANEHYGDYWGSVKKAFRGLDTVY